MSMLKDNYLKAQAVSDKVALVKKGRFLETVGNNISINSNSYVPRIMQWYRLYGFRKKNNEEHTISSLQDTIGEWIRGTTRKGCSAVYTLKKDRGAVSVMYGSGRYDPLHYFKANIPESEVKTDSWGNCHYQYSGLLTGTIRADRLADVAASSMVDDCYVACIIIPFSDEEIQRKIEENTELISYLDSYKSFQRVYGNASRRVETIYIEKIVNAISILKEENEYLLHNMNAGFVRTAVRFGAQTENDYNLVSSMILSSINSDENHSTFEPSRVFKMNNTCCSIEDCLAIPCLEIDLNNQISVLYAVSLQDVKSTITFCLPPLCSYKGYYIKDYNVNEDSKDAFPLAAPISEESISIGKIVNSDSNTVVPLRAIRSHVFVSGATDTGKTTTIKKALVELYEKGIPFTVIEAAKKEYISLLENIPELKVYTPGNDGNPLYMNPLQPEDGVLIEKHVEALVRALIATTGGEHPIPEAFDGLLKQTYNQLGWNYGMMAYTDVSRPFPTFEDVLNNIDSYIANHAKYGPEVRQNLTAALTLRTDNMHSGAMGSLFSKPFGLQSKDLLETPCVIELADFSPQAASFLMNMLLFKFHAFLSRKTESVRLDRVIVIEEAHNIFKKTMMEDSGRALNNEYFDKMLAEIRSTGTGLILSDQRPSIMSESVIANTSVKILHSLVDIEDKKVVGEPCNLTEFQLKKLGELKAGECIVAVRGYQGVQHTRINKATKTREFNSACHVCVSRFRCKKAAVRRMIQILDPSVISMHVSRIKTNPYNVDVLKNNINYMLEDLNVIASESTKICLLGELLETYGSISNQEKRVIVNVYASELRRRNGYE